jgi:putative spermidine/putrescine transport system permease protein
MGATNTLPLELRGLTTTVTTPIIYALGTITTLFSFAVIGTFFLAFWLLSRSRSKALR